MQMVFGIKCVQNDERKLTLSVDDNKPPVKGVAIGISTDIVPKVVSKTKAKLLDAQVLWRLRLPTMKLSIKLFKHTVYQGREPSG